MLDFADGSWSPLRRNGRSEATLNRAANGRRRFGDRFVMPFYGSGSGLTGRSLDRPIGTITTLARWAPVDGERMRMLTTAENREGMGFPAGYRLPSTQRLALQLLGNAVSPPVARDILLELRRAA